LTPVFLDLGDKGDLESYNPVPNVVYNDDVNVLF